MPGKHDATINRISVLLILSAILSSSLWTLGCDQPEPKRFRVGILCGLHVFASTVEGFRKAMQDLGYTENRNIEYDVHYTNFDSATEERILRKFVEDRVDLMLVLPSEVSVAAKEVTRGTGVPVVFCQTNIEGTNLIDSVPQPGGNITGVRYPGPDLALKRFEILHELAPWARRFWVPYTRHSLIVPDQLAALRLEAAQAGITLVEAPADTGDELIAELERRATSADTGIDAVLFISEPLARTPAVFPSIGRFASEHRIPIGGVLYSLDGYSTLFGVATDNIAVGRLAAQQAHKVLRGIAPGSIPVVSAESFFQLNYTAAQNLGIPIPADLLKQADEIVR